MPTTTVLYNLRERPQRGFPSSGQILATRLDESRVHYSSITLQHAPGLSTPGLLSRTVAAMVLQDRPLLTPHKFYYHSVGAGTKAPPITSCKANAHQTDFGPRGYTDSTPTDHSVSAESSSGCRLATKQVHFISLSLPSHPSPSQENASS